MLLRTVQDADDMGLRCQNGVVLNETGADEFSPVSMVKNEVLS